jgi:hypothetical protein
MTDQPFSTQRLLLLRKLTRAVAELLRGRMTEYLTALAPLLRPRGVLGDFVDGGAKEAVGGAEKAFKDLQSAYEAIAGTRLYNLPKELKPRLEVASTILEMTPVEYAYTAKTDKQTKTITVTSPLRWILSYAGFRPRRLRELLAEKTRANNALQECVLHYLLLQTVLSKQTDVPRILEALLFPVSTEKRPEFGELPITYISAAIGTIRPPDEVLIENTEITGMDLFEEVVRIDDILELRDPLQQQLAELVKKHAGEAHPPA